METSTAALQVPDLYHHPHHHDQHQLIELVNLAKLSRFITTDKSHILNGELDCETKVSIMTISMVFITSHLLESLQCHLVE
jgi:hypothetical protein